MRILSLFLIIFTLHACSASQAPQTAKSVPSEDPNLRTQIEAFINATSPAAETLILKQLAEQNILIEQVKDVLRTWPIEKSEKTGSIQILNHPLNGKEYTYAIYAPNQPAKPKQFPLLIVLHGMGGNGPGTLPRWVERLKDQYVILCPSYPMGAWWSINAEQLVLQLIQSVQSRYYIDPDRIFLSGLSNGAIGTFMIGMFYPDYFAGLIPIAGGITERLMHFLVNLKNTPMYIIHGKKDPIFPIAYLRRVNQILTDMKYSVTFREHAQSGMAHGGHFLPDDEVPGLLKWMQRQKRNINPKTVRMTREGNHLESIHWARITKGLNMAALQIPGPEQEPMHVKNGKIATLFAQLRPKNRIEVMGKNLLEFEIYLNSDMVDFKQPIRVLTQELMDTGDQLVPGKSQISFHEKIESSLRVLLEGFKKRRDPNLLFEAIIKVSTESKIETALIN